MKDDGPLRIASFNLHRFVGADGRRDPSRSLRTIAALEADVVVVQEFCMDDDGPAAEGLEAWGRRLGHTPIAGYTLRETRGEYGNAVFTRLPPSRVRRHRIDRPKREPRGVIDLELAWNGESLRLLATHLGLSWSERRWQIDRLATLIGSRPNAPTILAGDLNDWSPGGWQLRRLRDSLPRITRGRTFPARRPLLALDRIAASAHVDLQEIPVSPEEGARDASDHRPLLVELRRVPGSGRHRDRHSALSAGKRREHEGIAGAGQRRERDARKDQADASSTTARSTGEQLMIR